MVMRVFRCRGDAVRVPYLRSMTECVADNRSAKRFINDLLIPANSWGLGEQDPGGPCTGVRRELCAGRLVRQSAFGAKDFSREPGLTSTIDCDPRPRWKNQCYFRPKRLVFDLKPFIVVFDQEAKLSVAFDREEEFFDRGH